MEPRNILIELSHADDASAVEEFALQHSSGSVQSRHGQSGTYRSLIPSQLPGSGEQYAFQVDLDKCSGCKSCVSACHHMNGLSDEESWRRVNQWMGQKQGDQWIQTITSACHHCVNPECMNGCPVGAYEKSPLTGIVKHLDDQCIGCEYCIWKCPYEVPRYHETHGIVRKCDMCSERLSNNVEPACVQACPHDAIRIDIVNQEELTQVGKSRLTGKRLYPGAPDSSITTPSSNYHSKRFLRNTNWTKVDFEPSRNKAHWPLIWMLLMTQWGVGILTAHFVQAYAPGSSPVAPYDLTYWMGTTLIFGGLLSSFFHLGQPTKAWRFFLGLKTSWLSREILLFNTLAFCLCLLSVDALLNVIPLSSKETWATATVLCGWLGVFTSAMIYHDTKRPFWAIHRTGVQFLGSLLSGALACSLISSFFVSGSMSKPSITANYCVLVVFILGKSYSLFQLFGDDNQYKSNRVKAVCCAATLSTLLFTAGMITELHLAMVTGSVCATGCIMILDYMGRLEFFLQSKAPVMESSIQKGRHS